MNPLSEWGFLAYTAALLGLGILIGWLWGRESGFDQGWNESQQGMRLRQEARDRLIEEFQRHRFNGLP